MVRLKIVFLFSFLFSTCFANDVLRISKNRFIVHRSELYPFVEGESYKILDEKFKKVGTAYIIKNTERFSLARLVSGTVKVRDRLYPHSVKLINERSEDEAVNKSDQLMSSKIKQDRDTEDRWRIYTRFSQYFLNELNFGMEYPLGDQWGMGLQGLSMRGTKGAESYDGRMLSIYLTYYFKKRYTDDWFIKFGLGQVGVTTLTTYDVEGGGTTEVEQVNNGTYFLAQVGHFWQWRKFNLSTALGLRKYSVDVETAVDENIEVDLSEAPFQATEILAVLTIGFLW